MNKLEIFQEVYGKDYAFTETELSRLLKVTELIVRECVLISRTSTDGFSAGRPR
jgi:hypothetical protein